MMASHLSAPRHPEQLMAYRHRGPGLTNRCDTVCCRHGRSGTRRTAYPPTRSYSKD